MFNVKSVSLSLLSLLAYYRFLQMMNYVYVVTVFFVFYVVVAAVWLCNVRRLTRNCEASERSCTCFDRMS